MLLQVRSTQGQLIDRVDVGPQATVHDLKLAIERSSTGRQQDQPQMCARG